VPPGITVGRGRGYSIDLAAGDQSRRIPKQATDHGACARGSRTYTVEPANSVGEPLNRVVPFQPPVGGDSPTSGSGAQSSDTGSQ
jgi:hypothetical protein